MPSAPGAQAEVVDPRSLEWLAQLARPLVFTNGVFDILHRGHVTYLAQARALGASLLVALNGDASARRLGKGAGRPLNPLSDRLVVLERGKIVQSGSPIDVTAKPRSRAINSVRSKGKPYVS